MPPHERHQLGALLTYLLADSRIRPLRRLQTAMNPNCSLSLFNDEKKTWLRVTCVQLGRAKERERFALERTISKDRSDRGVCCVMMYSPIAVVIVSLRSGRL